MTHIVYIISPGGGPEAYIRTLEPWLKSKNISISIVTMGKITGFSPDVKVVQAKTTSFHYYLSKIPGFFQKWALTLRAYEQEFSIWKELKKLERIRPIDVVEITEGFPLTILSRVWKIIVRAHGSAWTFHHFCQDKKENIQAGIDLEKKQLSRAVAISPLSNHLADHLSGFCKVTRADLKVLPYPIDSEVFSPAVEPPKEVALMIVGRLEQRKGTDVFFKAMNRVWEIYPDVKIYVLGGESGLTKNGLLGMISGEKHSQVIFPGFVPRAELPAYYQKMTLYIAPTQYETFGFTILEAMACGLPVISSDVGAVPELIEDGIQGYLIPFGNASLLTDRIISLLSDKEKRKKMAIKAREKSLNYKLDVVGERMLRFYRSCAV